MTGKRNSGIRAMVLAWGGASLLVAGVLGGAGAARAQQGQGVDSDLVQNNAEPPARPAYRPPAAAPYNNAAPGAGYATGGAYANGPAPQVQTQMAPQNGGQYGGPNGMPPANEGTYHRDDLIGAAEGVFGKGAKGLADVISSILKRQGEPNGYIVGREAGGAFIAGVRYGSGTLYHRVEGQKPVYWTGPSIGFDAGANAAKTFVLVYNLYNTDDLYHRYGAGEGQAYFVGGFNVSYLRRNDVVLIPVRLGVGLRLGINGGYMKISRTSKWFPF